MIKSVHYGTCDQLPSKLHFNVNPLHACFTIRAILPILSTVSHYTSNQHMSHLLSGPSIAAPVP